MKRDDSSPRAYIESVEEPQKALLLAVRELIIETAPDAEEGIEYGMLLFGDIANLAAQKNYVSLYVAPKALTEFKKSHPKINCGKCCLRFRATKDLESLGSEAVCELIKSVTRLTPEDRGC